MSHLLEHAEEHLPAEVAECGRLVGVALGCNSIDIWNLRLELGRKLRQWLRKRLGRQPIERWLRRGLRLSLKCLLNCTPDYPEAATTKNSCLRGHCGTKYENMYLILPSSSLSHDPCQQNHTRDC